MRKKMMNNLYDLLHGTEEDGKKLLACLTDKPIVMVDEDYKWDIMKDENKILT